VKRFRIRFTPEAEEDLLRLNDFLLERDAAAAERALEAITAGIELLKSTPFSCRRAASGKPLLRELVVPFGSSGYVALFEIEGPDTVTIPAVRHQREDDFS